MMIHCIYKNTLLLDNLLNKQRRLTLFGAEFASKGYPFKNIFVMIKMPFLLLSNLNDINCGHVRKCVMRSIIFWTIYL